MVYFIAFIRILRDRDSGPYMEYIRDVRPIVQGFGGRYIVRIKYPNRVWIMRYPMNGDRTDDHYRVGFERTDGEMLFFE